MAALNIGMTDREATRDYTGLTSGHPVSSEIYEADQEAKRCWDYFTSHVDAWIASGDYLTMGTWQQKAEHAEAKSLMLRRAIHCKHENVDWLGSMHFGRDGAWDDIKPICRDCGAEIELDVTGEVSPDDQILV